ncbi:MAG: hypothetical protein WA964_06155 [Ilumatobacter sp.]|uniref:hypothetical protein n=1 Tax=Ilumatobacter sp. TaxID=1967498 RepID=UPI003C7161C7
MSAPIATSADGVGSRLLPVFAGRFALVTSAHGWAGRLLARRLGLPTTRSGHASGSLEIEAGECEEQWIRTFGTRTWRSTLTSGTNATLVEFAGPVRLHFALRLDERRQTRMTLSNVSIGAVPTPIARWLRIDGLIGTDATTTVTVQVPGGRCVYTAVPRFDGAPTGVVTR